MTPLAARAIRPVARHVRLHGGLLAVPAVIIIGVPVILDVPEIGPVSVPEDRYQALYDLLASDNPDDWERAYTELQQIKQSEVPTTSTDNDQTASAGPTNMVSPSFRVVHPPTSEPVAAPKDAPDLAIRFKDLPTRARRRLW